MMRKSTDAQRFPNSVTLFKFCLRVLEFRSKSNKIHDQAVGEILNYNPSDTSHWKRGKKSVRSIYALQALSQSLNVEAELIFDIADGQIDFDEAWMEFLDAEEENRCVGELTESQWLARQSRAEELEKLAETLHGRAQISSVPVFVPELLNALPFIQAVPTDVSERLAWSSRLKPGQYNIRYRKGEMRPHTRLALVREISRVLCLSEREQFGMASRAEELSYLEILDLASALLVPKNAFLTEVAKVSSRYHLVRKLSAVFWVPKSVIRSRLALLSLESAQPEIFSAPRLSVVLPIAPQIIPDATFLD